MSQNLPPEYKSDVVACVLAGGRAERLGGKNKGLMPWPLPESPPLVAEVLQRLRCQVGSVVINANAGIAKFEAYGYPVVSDAAELADMGPLTGIVAVGDISNQLDTVSTKNASKIRYYTFVEMFDFLQTHGADQEFEKYKGDQKQIKKENNIKELEEDLNKLAKKIKSGKK